MKIGQANINLTESTGGIASLLTAHCANASKKVLYIPSHLKSAMKTITWRFDDLNFAREGELYSSLEIQKEIVAVLDRHGFKATFGLVTRHNNSTCRDNKAHLNFVKQLHKNGHEIAAHGLYHESWKNYSSNELSSIISSMRQDFDDMGIPARTFIFPYLQTNWKAIPLLKKHGFDAIIKGENYRWKYLCNLIKSRYYSSRYSLDFFVPHSFSTEKSYHPPVLNLPKKIVSSKEIIHVMDHIWLYGKKDIKDFSDLVESTRNIFQWKTISQASGSRVKNA